MNTPHVFVSRPYMRWVVLLLVGTAGVAYTFRSAGEPIAEGLDGSDLSEAPAAASCAVALASHSGSLLIDREIAAAQKSAQAIGPAGYASLGWLFVAKARQSYDPGFYKIAESAADCALEIQPDDHDALLLRGHVLYSTHRFLDAGAIAAKLTREREAPFDYGLLGDVALSQGRTQEAIDAYQRMVDLRPNLQSYSRAAHIRWLRGDLGGATELMRLAAGAGTARDPESLAWARSQVAAFELQAGDLEAAARTLDEALRVFPDHAPALLLRGRMQLRSGEVEAAVATLERAAALNPLPEFAWELADTLRLAGRAEEAATIEAGLVARGPIDDPRTTSLYLATRAIAPSASDPAGLAGGQEAAQTALRLAREEISKRADVHTRDALAWALLAAGDVEGAAEQIAGVVAEGTRDARLFLHAGVIAARAGDTEAARDWLGRAAAIEQTLVPSEHELLQREWQGSAEVVSGPAEDQGGDAAHKERNN